MKRYGRFGGSYIPEILAGPIEDMEAAWRAAKADPSFLAELDDLLTNYAGRPTCLSEATRFQRRVGGPRVFLKREDLLHTGAHKLNNTIGQCLLAKRMGKRRVIAETGAGQHGVATATSCAVMGLECVVYMGGKDVERQAPNVKKMRLLGAEVVPVDQGSATLKDAVNEAMREWSRSYELTHYCLGSVLGPHPFPEMVAYFQRVIGKEARQQVLEQAGRLPSHVLACVGGGSNAIGIFSGFIDDPQVELIGVEGGGKSETLGEHAARFKNLSYGVLHGCFTALLQNHDGQVAATSSISAGLDYPAVGPEHAFLQESGRARYVSANDDEVLKAFREFTRSEGIVPALESAHALAGYWAMAPNLPADSLVLINLSGRGDKDLPQLFAHYEKELLG